MKPSTSNLARSWGLPRPIIKCHQKKSGCGPGPRELPEIWGFPFNIFATAAVSDFKFGTQLGFAKAHHKIPPRKKEGVWFYDGPWLCAGELPKSLGSSIIFLQRLGLATSNIARSWGLPRLIIKSHAKKGWAWPLARGALQNLGVPLQYLHNGWS